MTCYGNYASSGKQKSEDVSPQLAEDIRCLVEPESQADPQLRNTSAYKITGVVLYWIQLQQLLSGQKA